MAHDIDVILINFKYEETELLKKTLNILFW
jgi:hypothetical protein